jgi:predicted small secreted protein
MAQQRMLEAFGKTQTLTAWARELSLPRQTILSRLNKNMSPEQALSQSKRAHQRHGWKGTPEYTSWIEAKKRCFNPKNKNYASYGARGITMCQEWAESFPIFLAHMGMKPSPAHSLERKDNNKGYEQGNCRWATMLEQSRNRRTNRVFQFNGEPMIMGDVEKAMGLNCGVLKKRLRRGKTFEEAVTMTNKRSSLAAPSSAAKLAPVNLLPELKHRMISMQFGMSL